MKDNIIEKIKNNLSVLISKKTKEHADKLFKENDLIYTDQLNSAYNAFYEFDENIFNEAVIEALKKIDISDYFKRNYDVDNGLTHHRKIGLNNLEQQHWLTTDFKQYIQNLLIENNIVGTNNLHELIYNSIEFNTIDIYFNKVLEKNQLIYQHLDNDISSANASIEKLKSASHFLLDKMGNLPIKDILQIDGDFIEVAIDTFKNNNFIIDLVKILGKVSDSEKRKKHISSVKETKTNQNKNNRYNPSKINGIKLGNNISSIIPYQLAYRHNSRLSKIFDLNYLEHKLLIFDQKDRTNKLIQQKDTNKNLDDNFGGAFIICIDTSYSMKHFGDSYAKSFVLAMLIEAKKLNRKVYIINFSDNLDIFEIKDYQNEFDIVLKFLKRSYYAGTNLDLAIQKAIEIIENNDYSKSDIIVMSDFDVKSINKQLYNQLMVAKKNYNVLLYAFVLSRMPRTAFVEDYYDTKFLFNGTNRSIENIHTQINDLAKKYNV